MIQAQTALPGLAASPNSGTTVLLDDVVRGCRLTYEADFLSASDSSAWFTRLCSELPLAEEAPVMFGKPTLVRRRTCGLGEPGRQYRYSGVARVATPWPAGFDALLDALEVRTGTRFTFALVNFYPDGDAGLGWHADDERDLVRDAPIASLSLGAMRDFAVRLGRNGRACLSVPLASGSLLVMDGAMQRHYQHRVPPRARCHEPRLNLTFRRMR